MSLTDTAVRDMAGNNIEPQPEPVSPASFKNDTVPPELVYFSEFNYPNETITLTFSETVLLDTFDASQLSLQTFFTLLHDDPSYSLTGGIAFSSAEQPHVVILTLTTPDINYIKAHATLCFRRNTCWLSITSATVQDPAGNPVVSIPTSSAYYSVAFVTDEQRPFLEEFRLSVENETLTLLFSEPVDPEYLNPSAITLQSMPDASLTEQLTLTGGTTASPSGTQIVLQLSREDIRRIKAELDYLNTENDTYISFTEDLIRDASHTLNPVISLNSSQAQGASSYDEDVTGPVVIGSHLDLDRDQLIFTFDEPVLTNNDSFNFSLVYIQSSIDAPAFSHYLTPWILDESSADGTTLLIINLSPKDLATLKINMEFATSSADTYIRLQEGAITDSAENPNIDQIEEVSLFTPDQTLVSLQSFALDMNMGLIKLTFDDIVDASTFQASGITLQNAVFREPGFYHTLSDRSHTRSSSGYVLNVILAQEDLDQIKVLPNY